MTRLQFSANGSKMCVRSDAHPGLEAGQIATGIKGSFEPYLGFPKVRRSPLARTPNSGCGFKRAFSFGAGCVLVRRGWTREPNQGGKVLAEKLGKPYCASPLAGINPSHQHTARSLRRQGALASCRIAGEPKSARIRATSNRLTTRSSMRDNEYLHEAPPGTSEEGKRPDYL